LPISGLPLGGSQEDPGIQGGGYVAVSSPGNRPVDHRADRDGEAGPRGLTRLARSSGERTEEDDMKSGKVQDQSQIKWISDFIWNIADNRLRDVYVRGKYRDVILPFTVLRRLDAVLEETKQKVLERKRFLDKNNVAEQDGALRMAAGQAFYNVSEFTLAKLKASSQGQRLREDFIAYLDGFSPNVQEILTKFKFRDQIQTLVDAHVLGYLIEDFLDPEINLSPLPVKDADGRIKLPALDNHGMGTVFEELIRRFNEENNEE